MSEFIWTDELLGELLSKVTSYYPGGNYWADEIAAFKAAKQPKPEWEILLYKNRDGNPHPFEGAGDMSCTNMGCKIHSVKRLSDNQVFTAGDKCQRVGYKGTLSYTFKISSFLVEDDEMFISTDKARLECRLKDLRKDTSESIPVLLTPSEIEKLKTILNTTP